MRIVGYFSPQSTCIHNAARQKNLSTITFQMLSVVQFEFVRRFLFFLHFMQEAERNICSGISFFGIPLNCAALMRRCERGTQLDTRGKSAKQQHSLIHSETILFFCRATYYAVLVQREEPKIVMMIMMIYYVPKLPSLSFL